MKRALSLIIVLAMVLCMIPFSAFAADFGIAGDFVDGVITLVGTEEQTYLYTATEDGTVEVFAEAVVPEVAEGEEVPELAQPYILVDGADYTEAFAVTAGQSYEITFGDDAGIGGDVTVYAVFKGLPGTETNPYEYYNPTTGLAPADQADTTVSVEPGASVYYNLYYYANTTVKISGEGVKVVKGEEVVDGSDVGYVEFEFASDDRIVLIKITNKAETAQTYTIEGIVPVGTMDNPEVVTSGEHTAELAAGNQGYYYSYIAEGNGTVNVTVSAADAEGNALATVMGISNLTAYIYNDQTEAGTDSIAVSTGDELQIMVTTYNAEDMWNAPAGTVTTTIEFVEAEVGPIVIESLPYEATHSGVYEQAYTYTATEAGYLYVASTGWVEMNVAGTMNYAEGYGDGYVLAMNAGDVANINLYAYWGEETFTYNFSWLTEITPDGSYGYPFVAEIPADGTVVTLANDGDEAVYYVYTATEDCKIYNAFMESTTDVAAGESLMIYVAPGGIQVNYVLPVATVNGDVFYDLNEAVKAAVAAGGTAENPVEVTLQKDYVMDGALVLYPGAYLNMQAYSLTADYLVGLTGSYITGECIAKDGVTGAKLYVPQNAISLPSKAPANAKGQNIIPVWDNDHFVLSLMLITNTSMETTTDAEGTTIVKFQLNSTSYVKNSLLNDGGSDNDVSVIIRVSYTLIQDAGEIRVDQNFNYNDSLVATTSSNAKLTCALEGCDNYIDLAFTIVVLTDSGVEVTHSF